MRFSTQCKFLLSVTFAFMLSGMLYAQERTVTGTVTAAEEGALPGVNVLVKGTTVGTVTDLDGNYRLAVPEGNDVLVFSSIGYASQEATVGNRTTVDVVLQADITSLTEVVVVGYGTQKKTDVTGATATVSERDFNAGVINNPLQSVQGKVAGLNITTTGGDPTSNRPTIRLRGTSSLSANSEPLIVVDGVAGAPLNSVAPEDIASVNVLKDASAAAIYGSRGANGVIIITTKQGKAGKTTVEYNGFVGVESPAGFLPFLSADQYRAKLRELNLPVEANDYGASTDWFKEITRNAISHNQSIAVSGGTEDLTYRGSVVYLNQPGIALNSGYDRLNARLNLTQKAIDDKLEIQLLLSQQVANNNFVDYFSFLTAGRINPTFPVYNDQGTYLQPGVVGFDEFNGNRIPGGFEIENPVARMEQITNENREKQTLLNAKIFLEPVKGLRLGANGSLNNNNEIYGFFQPSTFKANGNNTTRAERRQREVVDKLLELTAQYSVETDIQNFSVLGGYTYQKLTNEGFRAVNRDFPDNFGYNNLNAGNANPDGSTNRELGSDKSEAILLGFIGRVNYGLYDKYLLTANIRRDGSSRFGENNRWGWFPSISAGWRISEENFMSGVDAINELKLRAGYGVTGNQDGIADYATRQLYGASGAYYTNGGFKTAYQFNQNANPDLKWESSAMANVGLDFTLFNARVTGSLEVYNKDTRDLLFDYPIAIGSKYGANNLTAVTNSILANVGQINNKGIELAVDFLTLEKENFQWRTVLNLSHNTNKIVSLSSGIFQYNPDNPRLYGGFGSGQGGIAPPIVLAEGYPIGQFYGPKFAGFSQNQDGSPTYLWEDFGGGGTDPFGEDRTFLGDAQPDLTFALGNTLTFGPLDVYFLFRGMVGHKIANGPYIYSANPNRFPGNNAVIDAFSTGIPPGLSPAWSDLWLESGNFVRLDNFRISYRLPKFWEYLSNAQVYVAGQNTFVLTNYRGIDPEPRSGASRNIYGDSDTGTNLSPGVEPLTFYPRTRSFTLGVSLQF